MKRRKKKWCLEKFLRSTLAGKPYSVDDSFINRRDECSCSLISKMKRVQQEHLFT